MKIPSSPPNIEDLFKDIADLKQLVKIGDHPRVGVFVDQEYIHWDKLKHLAPPEAISHKEWWLGIKMKREDGYIPLPLTDNANNCFQYLLAGPMPELLHQIDMGGGGAIQMPGQITNPDTKDRYYVNSLIEEAITSSQLEGAATTRKVAEAMIRSGRKPRDNSERMILNNFITMKRINALKKEPLTKELIFEIFGLITDGTLDDPSAGTRYRRADENIIVGNEYGDVFHRPPPAEQLDDLISALCDFANGKTPNGFVHPVIRSIVLHFWMSYIHPFVDGNGRTARALFYWSMLRYGYWLCEYISISNIIHKAPTKYGMAFLYTETDDRDLTYFIYYHLKVIVRAVKELHAYINKKTREMQEAERAMRGLARFNHRQQALISHAFRHPDHRYTIESHRMSHNVVHQTARMDLIELTKLGLVTAKKIKKRWYFTPVPDMADRLADLK
jgi:Fic family protein